MEHTANDKVASQDRTRKTRHRGSKVSEATSACFMGMPERQRTGIPLDVLSQDKPSIEPEDDEYGSDSKDNGKESNVLYLQARYAVEFGHHAWGRRP